VDRERNGIARTGVDGIDVRQATAADVEQIVALQVDRNGAEWEPMVRALLAHPDVGPRKFTVAVDGDRVVSSLCLLTAGLRIGNVDLAVGQPEFVATVVRQEHRGLVRAQMRVVHDWSARRGDLAQIITGIPYFYRRFGYEYAIPFPRVRLVTPNVSLALPEGWSVRRAAPDDAPAIVRLHDHAQAGVPLVATRAEQWWRWSVGVDDPAPSYVAETEGTVHGIACIGAGASPAYDFATNVRGVAFDRLDALDALMAEAAQRRKPVAIEERGRHTGPAEAISQRHPLHYALYVRVPDPVALLDRLRPVLSERLTASPRATTSGRLLLSTYSSSIAITYERGAVVSVEAGPPLQDPVGAGGAGVPPDLVATLVFGRYGATGLAARHDDVRLGQVADLMETLFPRLDADVAALVH
jgi:hypothetical protein